MKKWRRIAWVLASLAAAIVLAALTAVLTLRSTWFYTRVRDGIVSRMEAATGGRVEIESFRFDWRTLRAEVKGLTLHGTEPAGKPPLLRCASVAVGLKIISLVDRDIDIQSLEVNSPRVYLTIGPDGRTNIPEPKAKTSANAVETVFKLAIGQYGISNGELQVEGHGETPFDLHGHDLDAHLSYEAAGPRYRGEVKVAQALSSAIPMPVSLSASVAIERNRMAIDRAALRMGESQASISGTMEDFAAPHGSFQYDARVTAAEAGRMLHTTVLERGTAQSSGVLTWHGGRDFTLSGKLNAYGLAYRDAHVRIRNFQADGSIEATPGAVRALGMRVAGRIAAAASDLPVEGRVAEASLRGKDLDLRGVALSVLDGSFQGEAALREFERYTVTGEIAGFAARRVLALYSSQPLPWDALASGRVNLQGVLGRPGDLHAEAALAISPAATGAPVHGQVQAVYDARSGVLDLGRSTVSLPSSTATVSGAMGRQLRVHLQSRDLDDLLPVIGESDQAIPVKLASTAAFEGTVTGSLDNPQISGHLSGGRFSWQGRDFDGFQAAVAASPENVHFANASLARGTWRAQFELAVSLDNWKASDASRIFGSGGIQNAAVSELASLAGASVPATGAVSGTGQASGTIGNPLVNGEIAIVHGSFRDEPFEAFTARANYSSRNLEITAGQITAGAKQVQVNATWSHQPENFAKGRLQFQVSTNAMPLDQIRTLEQRRPGLSGTIQATAAGTFDLPLRIHSLTADITARSLQLSGQPLGDVHVTATSKGPLLSAHLESDFASSSIKGDGQWRLEGDYPGTADVAFAKLDFAQLRSWLMPASSGAAADLGGYTAGSLHIEGPALKPGALQAELRLPEFTVNFAPAGLEMHNSGPIVVRVADSIATVESARLTGRNTDLALTGKLALDGKDALNARIAGRVDLAIVHEWNRDFTSSGILEADATLRGSLNAPQIAGRAQFQRAAFNIADVPNGISNANGAVVFSGGRASIQSFTGETGGGKIQLSGFVAYGGGPTIFRLHAAVAQVRVRYPEGVSTVANASLNFTGSTDRSMLAGTVTILRTSFNPQADFSSFIVSSAEPVRTPAARTGFLGGLNFDINIETSPDVQVQSTLTQDVQLEANLHLRGTESAPALLGRINVTQGQVVFFGTRYRIGQGSISFFNPLAIEPVLNADLETKARGIDVTLTVAGPLNKLNLSYRSDPPLQFSEIVALLATGRTPTSDAALMSSQNPAAQPFQQMGASALLGEAITSPVTGRLQRFFGVSRLRIDPTLPGVEYNPQARLTLEQQVTQDITFTYITDVTSTNPQVVSVEWAFAKQWSVVAQRDENGMIGMDIFFKKRF